MTEVPEGTHDYWKMKQESYQEKMLTTERRMWRAWNNFKKWKSMIRRLGQKRNGKEHPNSLRQFTARDEMENKLMDMVRFHEISLILLKIVFYRHVL